MTNQTLDRDPVPAEPGDAADDVASGPFHRLTVRRVIDETPDARSFVLEVPAHLRDTFRYRAGQFCTFRVRVGDALLARCYSMSSSPEVDDELTVTVKRVAGGAVSNWLNDHVTPGAVLDATPPAGRFCLASDAARSTRPLVAFCGGSGITPVISLVKTLLRTTTRRASLLYANRDRDAIIFRAELDALARAHADRLRLVHRLDVDDGFVDPGVVLEFAGREQDADFFVCGPGPFMDVVEEGLRRLAVPAERIFIERFVLATDAAVTAPQLAPAAGDASEPDGATTETVTIVLHGREHTLAYHAGETILETARRGGLAAPFSCEQGICGTCLARTTVGTTRMKANNVLTPDEVEGGLVLTCQGVPTSKTVVVEYEG